jgi:HPt (histidine-containing phosphotransfer) domain-containing protein
MRINVKISYDTANALELEQLISDAEDLLDLAGVDYYTAEDATEQDQLLANAEARIAELEAELEIRETEVKFLRDPYAMS